MATTLLEQVEELVADMILLELSDIDTARTLSSDQQTLRQQSQQSINMRARANAEKIKTDAQSGDPLIKRKAMLLRQLAIVVKQIQQNQQRQNASMPQQGQQPQQPQQPGVNNQQQNQNNVPIGSL